MTPITDRLRIEGPTKEGGYDIWFTKGDQDYLTPKEAAVWKVAATLGWPEGNYTPLYLALYSIKPEWLEQYAEKIDTLAAAMLKNLGWVEPAQFAEAA